MVAGVVKERMVSNMCGYGSTVSPRDTWILLTEVAGEGGTNCPPQKFLSSQKFRHLMG